MASKFASSEFWTDAADRAVASFAQALVVTAALETTGLLAVDWVNALSISGAYALASLLSSVAWRGGDSEDRGE